MSGYSLSHIHYRAPRPKNVSVSWRKPAPVSRKKKVPEPPADTVLIGHCGTWHRITEIPTRLSCCGYLVTDPDLRPAQRAVPAPEDSHG